MKKTASSPHMVTTSASLDSEPRLRPAFLKTYDARIRSVLIANKIKYVAILVAGLICCSVHANIIPLGQVTLSGDFTLNHLYDFNHPADQPFGWLGTQTVQNSSGLFAPYIQAGMTLPAQPLWSVNDLPILTIGGFTFATFDLLITGADSGRYVLGLVNITGNGYEQGDTNAWWSFTAPGYDIGNFHNDITGPITLGLYASFDNGHVPDGAYTAVLFGIAVIAILGIARVWTHKPDILAD